MSSFDLAIPLLLHLEGDGAISHDEDDPGGVTKWGISKRSYPTVDIENLTREQAIAIYRHDWWNPAYQQIIDQNVGCKVFCLAPNMGAEWAHICLQRAVRATSSKILEEDGILGKTSLAIINEIPGRLLLTALKSEAAGHYRMINNPKELKGWLNRAYA